jgi:2-amino-4-hydroxy-6-hydroxymethyldihydropteridine diphosphokinase
MKHEVYLILGTNIEPEQNTKQAIHLLSRYSKILEMSSTWETVAVGSTGPNFLNTALRIECEHSPVELKVDVISVIENELGRIRTSDKNAPRTVDLDIVIYDDMLIDPAVWTKAFIAIPMAELRPELVNEKTGETLKEAIRQFEGQNLAFHYPLVLEMPS